MKTCASCQHFVSYGGRFECHREFWYTDLVTGDDVYHVRWAEEERRSDKAFFTRRVKCGPDARFWEAAEPLVPPRPTDRPVGRPVR